MATKTENNTLPIIYCSNCGKKIKKLQEYIGGSNDDKYCSIDCYAFSTGKIIHFDTPKLS